MLVGGVGFDRLNEVRDEVVPLAEVDVNAAERVSNHVAPADEAVVDACNNDDG